MTDFEVLKKLSIMIRSCWVLFERIRKLSRSLVVYFMKADTSKLILSLKVIICSVLVRILVSLGPISFSMRVISRFSSLLLQTFLSHLSIKESFMAFYILKLFYIAFSMFVKRCNISGRPSSYLAVSPIKAIDSV